MKIGILGLQGGVYEHIYHLRQAYKDSGIDGKVIIVKDSEDISRIDGIIIPGGESTTIGKLVERLGITRRLRKFIMDGSPTMGICAGAILLAKETIDRNLGTVEQPILQMMDIRAIRNYFGRQKHSFETLIDINGLDGGPYPAIFIRAPVFEPLSNKVLALATLDEKIVMALQDNILVTSFHPELTNDTRIHRMFINLFKI